MELINLFLRLTVQVAVIIMSALTCSLSFHQVVSHASQLFKHYEKGFKKYLCKKKKPRKNSIHDILLF